MPSVRLVPSSLEPFALARTHEGPWYGQDPTGYELVAASAVRSLGLRLGFYACFVHLRYRAQYKEINAPTERRKPALIVTGLVMFLKPCAFGAPQAASGLDQRHQPGEGTAVSSMPAMSFADAKKNPP
jgi:hypothetical protein